MSDIVVAIPLTLHRPLTIPEDGYMHTPAIILPAGSKVFVEYRAAGLECAITVDGREYFGNRFDVYEAAAKVPCEHAELTDDYSDWSDCTYYWLACRRFHGGENSPCTFCHGDKTRCPSSKVRAEATPTTTTEEG